MFEEKKTHQLQMTNDSKDLQALGASPWALALALGFQADEVKWQI